MVMNLNVFINYVSHAAELVFNFIFKYKVIVIPTVVYLMLVYNRVHHAKRFNLDTLVWNPKPELYDELCVYEEDLVNYNIYDRDVAWPRLLIKSDRNLYNLTMYNNVKWKGKRFKEWEIDKNDKEDIKSIITPKECVIIKVYLAETIADQILEFENEDHMIFRVPMQCNGKFGEISIPVQYKLTFRSWIHFLTLGIIDYKSI